jgi:hypothetical protein
VIVDNAKMSGKLRGIFRGNISRNCPEAKTAIAASGNEFFMTGAKGRI